MASSHNQPHLSHTRQHGHKVSIADVKNFLAQERLHLHTDEAVDCNVRLTNSGTGTGATDGVNFGVTAAGGGDVTVHDATKGFTVGIGGIAGYVTIDPTATHEFSFGGGLNTSHHLGEVKIGRVDASDTAFAHEDNYNTTDYAIKQGSAGNTNVNCKLGSSVYLNTNGSLIAQFSSGFSRISNKVIAGDYMAPLEKVEASASGATAVALRATNSVTGYAATDGVKVGVTAAGVPEIQCGNSADLLFNVGGDADRMTIEASATGGLLCNTGSDSTHHLGRLKTGFIWVDHAALAHENRLNGNDYMLAQNSVGLTYINAAPGQSVKHCVNGTSYNEVHAANTVLSHHFLPATTDSHDMGSASYRWRTIYTNNTVNVSDARTKENITEFKNGIDFVRAIRATKYQRKNGSGRDHLGFISQEVRMCADEKYPGGSDKLACWIMDNKAEEGSTQGLRYNELLAASWSAMRHLDREVRNLKKEMEEVRGVKRTLDEITPTPAQETCVADFNALPFLKYTSLNKTTGEITYSLEPPEPVKQGPGLTIEDV